MQTSNVELFDFTVAQYDAFMRDVTDGLSRPQKKISPKYLYDHRGSKLFDEICALDEYYLTRVEIATLNRYADEIATMLGSQCLVFEFGIGSSVKSRILLNAMKSPHAYVPIDISKAALMQSAWELGRDFPKLKISALCADFTTPLALPDRLCAGASRRVGFFPGSTIGNFDLDEALLLLKHIGSLLRQGGRLIIGVDLLKSKNILEPAYNDSKGVTAAFNLNLLERINEELNANFKVSAFRHQAHLNSKKSRIEMHLQSIIDQQVDLAGQSFFFRAGETIHTENSYKYSHESFSDMAESSGYSVMRAWTDPGQLIALYCLEVR